jgi:hypothetical protein
MAKAHIETPDGISVKLEGTPAEIAAVLKDVKAGATPASGKRNKSAKVSTGRVTVQSLVTELKTDGFFKKPKALGEIRTQLADIGHNYPLTALSGPMRELVRSRVLRRFKEKGKYVYAQ